MNIKICDSIMGSGKTSAAFNYIINHKHNKKFIFISPYLKETERVVNICNTKEAWYEGEYWGEYPSEIKERIDFYLPQEEKGSKLNGLKSLLKEKRNIATTHALFSNFDSEVVELISNEDYTLIIDECPSVIDTYEKITPDDCQLLFDNLVDFENGYILKWKNSFYTGMFNEQKEMCKNGRLVGCRSGSNNIILKMQPINTITCFKDVLILTYMFEGQFLKYYFDLNEITYDYCIATKSDDGKYILQDVDKPPIDSIDKSLINIYEGKYNEIGDGKYKLSKNWYTKNDLSQLKKNLYNYNRYYIKAKADDIIWTCYQDFEKYLSGRGFKKSWLECNRKATNDYKDRSTVCYLINRFGKPDIINFFKCYGITIDVNKYALSELLQFIWRSRIRENKPINLYLPSSRMRELLYNWLGAN